MIHRSTSRSAIALGFALILGAPQVSAQKEWPEAKFLRLLHELQFTETAADLAKRIPNCPEPGPDAGGGPNTEIVIKTKLFGFPARGEFNFHRGVLVSHGFFVRTPTYEDAHGVFRSCAKTLDEQVDGLRLSSSLPFGLDGGDDSDGPEDLINIYLEGEKENAGFQVSLNLRADSADVHWGAQKIPEARKKKPARKVVRENITGKFEIEGSEAPMQELVKLIEATNMNEWLLSPNKGVKWLIWRVEMLRSDLFSVHLQDGNSAEDVLFDRHPRTKEWRIIRRMPGGDSRPAKERRGQRLTVLRFPSEDKE